MKRQIKFVGHDNMPAFRADRGGEIIPEEDLGEILQQIVTAPKDKAAVFLCEDHLHAIKVANRLRVLMGSGYIFSAHRNHVYAKKKEG